MVEFLFLFFILFIIQTKSSVPLNIEHGQHSWASTQLSPPHSFCPKLWMATYKLHVEPYSISSFVCFLAICSCKYSKPAMI